MAAREVERMNWKILLLITILVFAAGYCYTTGVLRALR
jgi:hypothetical protein